MTLSLQERLYAAENALAPARELAAGSRFDEAEQVLDSTRPELDSLSLELTERACAAGPSVDERRLDLARNILPLVALRALFAARSPAPPLDPFFEGRAEQALAPQIVELFLEEFARQTAAVRDCRKDPAALRGCIEQLEARSAILGRFVFLFRLQCLAEAVLPGNFTGALQAIAGDLQTLRPYAGGESVRSEQWRTHDRNFAALLDGIPAVPAFDPVSTPTTPIEIQTYELVF